MLESEIKKLTSTIENLIVAIGQMSVATQPMTLGDEIPEIPEPINPPVEFPNGTHTEETAGKNPVPAETLPPLDLPGAASAAGPVLPGQATSTTTSMLPPESDTLSEVQQYTLNRIAEMSAALGRTDVMQGLMTAWNIEDPRKTPDETLRPFLEAAETTFTQTLESLKAQGAT